MPSSRDDDLDWLYGSERAAREPEPTRVMPIVPGDHQVNTAARSPAAPSGPPPGPPPGAHPPTSYAELPRQPVARPRKRRRPVRTFFRVLTLLVVLLLVGLLAAPVYAWNQINRVDNTPGGTRPANQPGTTFLLVGSDSRKGLTAAERKRLGTGKTEGQRTDTIMVLSIPPGGKPALISIPRDSYLPIPDNGQNKINASYAFGGPKLLTQTVEQNTGLRIDGYLEIGFGGFVNIIDSLGGIEMCLPKKIKDKDSHLNLPKGCQKLDGKNALGYVRMRKADPKGDLGRVERQRQMLSAVAKKAASPATVVNPVRYWQVNKASGESLTLGEDTSFVQTLFLVNAMRRVAGDDGYTLTVPIADSNAQTAAGSAVLWDGERAKAMFGEISRGDTSDLKKYES